MEEIKKLVQKAGPFRIAIVVMCGIFLLLLSCGGSLFGESDTTEAESIQETLQQSETTDSLERYKGKMEQELSELLQKVEGVGQVQVMLTLKASNEKVTLKDNISKGSDSEEETVLIEDSDRNSSPYVIQEKEPEIEGVVIVCDGGEDPVMKREITGAVSALFQIESHKIKIMKSKEAKE
ncbi:MAG: stage III sporulation protein AG [Lachnospiraceae bacterium]|nr:stage III sporulation protein AG [Lachnospiraceae bacterium]